MTDTFIEAREKEIKEHNILIYGKGTESMPMCGFSARVVDLFLKIDKPFHMINVLENPEIRARLKEVSGWPTFPQVFVNGELIGGCDITEEMYESGELEKLVEEAFVN